MMNKRFRKKTPDESRIDKPDIDNQDIKDQLEQQKQSSKGNNHD